MFQHFECLGKLKRKEVAIVVHDPGEISKFNEPYLKYWNCYAVSNAEELTELLNNVNIDTSKIVQNARKLLDRHINAVSWRKISKEMNNQPQVTSVV